MWFFFFFFQAEDGIRDLYVTGVQTCALPIFPSPMICGILSRSSSVSPACSKTPADTNLRKARQNISGKSPSHRAGWKRSEERRVGKECRSRWSLDHEKKKKL